jgi:hypothetical protein
MIGRLGVPTGVGTGVGVMVGVGVGGGGVEVGEGVGVGPPPLHPFVGGPFPSWIVIVIVEGDPVMSVAPERAVITTDNVSSPSATMSLTIPRFSMTVEAPPGQGV